MRASVSVAIALLAGNLVAGENEIASLLRRADHLASLEVRRESLSIPLYRKARELARSRGDGRLEAEALVGLGGALISIHRYDEATALLEREALPLTGRLGLHGLESLALRRLNTAATERGQFDKALSWGEAMLRLGRRSNDPGEIAGALNNIAATRRKQGEIGLALVAIEEAMRMLEAEPRLRQTRLDFTIPYLLGRCLLETGDYPRSLIYLEQARVAAERLRHIGGIWHCLSDTALWYELQGDHRRAALFYERALAVSRRTDSRDLEVLTLRGIADVQRAAGDLSHAEANYRTSLEISGRHRIDLDTAMALLGLGAVAIDEQDFAAARRHLDSAVAKATETDQPIAMALARFEFGRLALRTGEPAQAERHYREALAVIERLGFRSLAPSAYAGLASAARARGELDAAIALYARSDEAIRRLRATISSAEQRSAFAAATHETYAGWVDALLAAGRPHDALAVVERVRTPVRSGRDSEDAAPTEREIARIQLRLSSAALPAEERRQLLGQLDDHERALVLRETGKPETGQEPSRPSSSALGPGEVYVAIVETSREAIAFVLAPGSLRIARLRPGGDLPERITFFTDALQGDAAAARASGLRIATEVVMPWRSALPVGTRRLLVSRSGVYARIPLAAVPDPARDGRPLVASFEIADVPSLASISASRARPAAKHALLAIGVEQPRRVSIGGDSFAVPPLPNARREIETIARTVGTTPVVLLDASAGEREIKRLVAGSYSLIHFAAHAFLDPRIASRSAIVLVPSGTDDGLLQTREIRQLHLDGSVVVLSSCRTALGPISPAESMQSLGRACLDAGARGVVATFWDIRDRDSAKFIRCFYRHLSRGITTGAALRAAQRETMARDPYANAGEWAAFTIVGDGAVAPLPARRARWPLLLIAGIAITALLGWHFRSRVLNR